jgi:hypothetical protein
MTPTWQENLSAELDRFEERVAGISHDDDDTPAMPTLEDALARLAMESPEAARAARNFLEGTDNLRTVWVRFRVSERERTQIDEGMRAAGVEKISEYCRNKVLG